VVLDDMEGEDAFGCNSGCQVVDDVFAWGESAARVLEVVYNVEFGVQVCGYGCRASGACDQGNWRDLEGGPLISSWRELRLLTNHI
jgi:hypothetical protein